jgi:hypothetical protein
MRTLVLAVTVIERTIFFRIGRTLCALAPSYQRSKPHGPFASLIDVLHHSRRRQAQRILRQHQYLIANSDQRAAFSQLLNIKHHNAGQ